MSNSEELKSISLEIGFHAVGIAEASPELLHGISAPARSMVCVALSYLTDSPNPGYFARFSLGRDYHAVLRERLAKLAERLPGEVYVDTNPMNERALAVRAGLGFRGENGCVYAGEYGSFVVLGELLTEVELEPSAPAEGGCLRCGACVRACPTGALAARDPSRCLSRITQMKGPIPRELREALGCRVYGCDTCQSVCPLNAKARPGNLPEFAGESPHPLDLVNISPADFREKIAPTTAGWIRRTRLRRNAAVALGNVGNPRAIPSLTEALSDPEPLVRAHAAWALGCLSARSALETALSLETDEAVEAEIRAALE
ncbi:MAG: tRNA epoxyqueuosine(34) reductase QueG [Armatimonadota bacterium]